MPGILASIETGLAHLTPDQRRNWGPDAEYNPMLNNPVALASDETAPTASGEEPHEAPEGPR